LKETEEFLNQIKSLSKDLINNEIDSLYFEFTNLINQVTTGGIDYTKIKRSINNMSSILKLGGTNSALIEPTDITKVIHDELPDVIKLPREWTRDAGDTGDVNMIYGH
jgi:hypothetical protein